MKFANVYENTTTFDSGLRDYMYLIYKNMGIALLISAVVAFFVSNIPALMHLMFSNFLISLLVQLAPVIYVFGFGRNFMNLSEEQARNKLYIFSGLMGLSLSVIFWVYTKQSIIETFLTTGITFGCMSLYGYRTKKDLTSLGSFLFMGVIGLLIASIINIFMRSSGLSFAISCIGVIIFTLYTAYDVQKIKQTYNYISNSADGNKIAILGALELYIDFINLFMYLLHFLGDRRE